MNEIEIDRPFLPAEFLTWLWFRCEEHGGTFELSPGDEFALAIDDGLKLHSWEGGDGDARAAFEGGTTGPTVRPEAARALAEGLLLSKARFVAARGSREWTFTLDYRLDLGGVKVKDADEEEAVDALAEKLAAVHELRLAIEHLYGAFLTDRLNAGAWRLEVYRMTEWVRGKLRKRAKSALEPSP